MAEFIEGPVAKLNKEPVRPDQESKMKQLNSFLPTAVTFKFREGTQGDSLVFVSGEYGKIKILPDTRDFVGEEKSISFHQMGDELHVTHGSEESVLTEKELPEGRAGLFKLGENFLGVTHFEDGKATFFKVSERFLKQLFKEFDGSSQIRNIQLAKPIEIKGGKKNRGPFRQGVHFLYDQKNVLHIASLKPASDEVIPNIPFPDIPSPIYFEIGEEKRDTILGVGKDGGVSVDVVAAVEQTKSMKTSRIKKLAASALLAASLVAMSPIDAGEPIKVNSSLVSPEISRDNEIQYRSYEVQDGDTYGDLAGKQLESILGEKADPSLVLLLEFATAGINGQTNPDVLNTGETILIPDKDTTKRIVDSFKVKSEPVKKWGQDLNKKYQEGQLSSDDIEKSVKESVGLLKNLIN